MDRRDARNGGLFANDVSKAGHDGLALSMREKFDFYFHILTDPEAAVRANQRPGDAEIKRATCMPLSFIHTTNTHWPGYSETLSPP